MYFGFLYYLLSAATSMCLNVNVFLGTKITLWLLHVFSGVLMFCFSKCFFKDNMAAFFAATAYCFSYQHIGMILDVGALPLSVIFLLMPLTFYLFELYQEKRLSCFDASWSISLCLSSFIFTHLQYGAFAVMAFCFWVASRVILGAFLHDRKKTPLDQAPFIISTSLITAWLTCWYIVPLLLEKQHLLLSNSNTAAYLVGGLHDFKLQRLPNLFIPFFNHDHLLLYVGNSIIYFCLVSILFFRRNAHSVKFVSLLTMFFAGLFFSFQPQVH